MAIADECLGAAIIDNFKYYDLARPDRGPVKVPKNRGVVDVQVSASRIQAWDDKRSWRGRENAIFIAKGEAAGQEVRPIEVV